MASKAATKQQSCDFVAICGRYRMLPAEIRAKSVRMIIKDTLHGVTEFMGVDIEIPPKQVSKLLVLGRLASLEDIASQVRVLWVQLESKYHTIERNRQEKQAKCDVMFLKLGPGSTTEPRQTGPRHSSSSSSFPSSVWMQRKLVGV